VFTNFSTLDRKRTGEETDMKVILILPFSSLVTGRDFKVDMFADGFHTRIAQQIWKRTKKYQLECWRTERKLKRAITGERDGIVYRAFPSFRPTLGSLDMHIWKAALATLPYSRRIVSDEYSLPMLKELKKQCQDEEVLIQINASFAPMTYLISLCCQNVPIVFAHTAGPPQTYSALTFISRMPFSFMERKAISYTDKILVQSKWIYDRLSKLFPNVTLCCPWGVDFEKFKPLGKQEARNALGIPPAKKVLLYVGHLDSIKGVDLILKVYKELKTEYDVELLLVGAQKADPLYHEAIEAGAIVREWVSQSELIPYYSAADVFLLPKFYSRREVASLEEFMSIAVAQIESMACGTPAVGTNLNHFLGSENELKEVGKIPSNPGDVAQCVAEILEHPNLYQNCREIAQRYYGWDGIVKCLVDIYDELFQKYYK
jgi:glycosyltransferase involved in cell wall biosynthesis